MIHISFSFVADTMPKFLLEMCSEIVEYQKGQREPVECSAINCHLLIQ